MARAVRKSDGDEVMVREPVRPKASPQKTTTRAIVTRKVAASKAAQRKKLSFGIANDSEKRALAKTAKKAAAPQKKTATRVARSRSDDRTWSNPERRAILDKVSSLIREKGAARALAAIEQIIQGEASHDPSRKLASGPHDIYEAEAKRWKDLRMAFLREYRSVTAPELAELTGSKSKNPSSRAHEWLRAGKIFAINDGAVVRYPLFQLDLTEGKPRPEIQKVLAYLREKLSDWQIAMWFTTPNTMAGNWRRPIELLNSEIDQVVKAAEFEVAETVL
ncbi:hypothetical protein [Acidisoma silvae]|uniref:DUF2384 domain-containing protein n=1 Tax=Acidisoma silvae TaxID=2802396 RepID=A0A963YVC8_9PROT|nr:hypothetical protein [Acidisoma silvae]MCB8877798.1 hypothetical protein [Acidisoma silvae]